MIIKHWNFGTDWWLIPSIFVKKADHFFEIGFRFLKFEIEYCHFTDVLR